MNHFGASWREQETDFVFTYFQLEFEAYTLWIRSTHEHYNFTAGELQTPPRNDSMIISLFWWECLFVKTLHLNQHHHSRIGFGQGGNSQYRSVVLRDQVRYSLTVFYVALHNVWSHFSYILNSGGHLEGFQILPQTPLRTSRKMWSSCASHTESNHIMDGAGGADKVISVSAQRSRK